MKNRFIPRNDAEKAQWLRNFADKMPTYATHYNISPAEVTALKNDSNWFSYWLKYLSLYNTYLSSVTAFKNAARDNLNEPPGQIPTPPDAGPMPTEVPPGIFVRANKMALGIKKRLNYSPADGKDLGIEGTLITEADLEKLKPRIKVYRAQGGHPAIKWVKKQTDGIAIFVDRGSGTFTQLAIDLRPNYIDVEPLPATAQIWKYQAIYIKNDRRIGKWSDIVSIAVSSET